MSYELGYTSIQSLYFMVIFSECLKIYFWRCVSIFSVTHKNLINLFLSTTGSVRMEVEHLIHGENCSKILLGIRETPEIKGCFACPLRGSCLAPLWSPPHHAGISLKRGIYNKTWQNGGNMIDSSVWLRPAVIMWNICSCLVCSSALQCNYLWAWLQWDLWKAKYYQGIRLQPANAANAAANCNCCKMSFPQGLPDTCSAGKKFPSHEEMQLNGSSQSCSF